MNPNEENKMKKTLTAALMSVALVPMAFADGHEEKAAPRISPVEIYTCNYNEGKGRADLDQATAGWNAWADEQGTEDYFALVMTPWYSVADDIGFDVAWLGTWRNGTAMGAGTDLWLATGGTAAAGFAEAITCDAHVGFASIMTKAPASDSAPDNLVLTFADCSIKEGTDSDAFWSAMEEWTVYTKERGYQHGQWVMYPAYGSGKVEYGFKMVNGYDSHTALGKDWDLYAAGDYDKHGELLGDKLDCDVQRMYNAPVVRRMSEDD